MGQLSLLPPEVTIPNQDDVIITIDEAVCVWFGRSVVPNETTIECRTSDHKTTLLAAVAEVKVFVCERSNLRKLRHTDLVPAHTCRSVVQSLHVGRGGLNAKGGRLCSDPARSGRVSGHQYAGSESDSGGR